MNIKDGVRGVEGKIVNGVKVAYIKLTNRKKDGNGKDEIEVEKKEILSDEEISKLPTARIFNNVVEIIDINRLLCFKIIDHETLRILRGENKSYKYICSIYAGKYSAISAFESYLNGYQIKIKRILESKIKRYGSGGFYHFFINSKPEILWTLREGAMMYSREKVADVIKENQKVF